MIYETHVFFLKQHTHRDLCENVHSRTPTTASFECIVRDRARVRGSMRTCARWPLHCAEPGARESLTDYIDCGYQRVL